ncbi:hypothetical protein [Klebsiella variicola]|uniref:hypothetical protein n=1 Tax=Klebsiella variicola TaxID=244366 RepID=UPI002B05EB50|nr:hypothetical protein [Klebsiella variicola]
MKIEEQYIESIYSYCQGVESQIYNLKEYANELIVDESQKIKGRKHLSSDANDNVSRYLKYNLGSILNAHASVLDYFFNLLLTKVGFRQDEINGQTFSLIYDRSAMSFLEKITGHGKKNKAFEELGLEKLNVKIEKYREEHKDNPKGMPYNLDLMREIFLAYFKDKHYSILSKRKDDIDAICDIILGYTQRLHPAMVHQSYTPAILKELNNLVKHNFTPDIISPVPYKGLYINLKTESLPYLNDGLLKKILELDLSVFKDSESLMKQNKGIAYKDIPLFNETNIFGFEFLKVTDRVNFSEFMIDKIFFVKTKTEIIISYDDILREVLKTIGDIKESIDSLITDDRLNYIKKN